MVLRYCFGMIMSVSTLIILSGAATSSSLVNFSMVGSFRCSIRVLSRLRLVRKPLASLDVPHVMVRQAEMMADLMHQHMCDDGAQGLIMLGPIVENWPAVEPDHVRHLRRRAFGAKRQADPLEEAEQVELGLRAQFIQHVVLGEILDPNDETIAQRAKFLRQPAKCRLGEDLELLE